MVGDTALVTRFAIMGVVRRVSVVGNSGSGKSTLASALAEHLEVPWIELDSIYHQPGWIPLPAPDFRARVEAAAAGDAWVIDGNYTAVRDLVWARADTVVWLDLRLVDTVGHFHSRRGISAGKQGAA